VTKIIRSGKPDSLGDLDTIQGDFRTQIDALTDAMRQLAGQAEIAPGATTVNNPLNAPYVLYVDANIGTDTFVKGDYAAADDGTYETKMKRISLQRLQCGYTVARPFRTISRAVIEAGIITSRDYLDLVPAPCGDLVTIIVGSGIHTALNGDGGTVSGAWTDGYEPTDAELTEFNPSNGGIVLPRGCSLVSLDLRKTIIRPDSVPEPVDEGNPLVTRRAIFKLTGGNYAYGFTFFDKLGFNKSHHLLDGFQFAGETQLDEFYANIRAAFSGVANIDDKYAVTRASEYRIVGPQPATPVEAVDTTEGASPYIYNISLRSEWGMCGMWASGDIAVGFRSMVVAQYTGVSLQRDLNSWQRYSGGTWGTFTDYDQLIAQNPNDVRFNPQRRSYHVRTTSNAVIQEVSVFAIGQAIHHLAESGSQITITNSNSNFGGCAAIATGFLDVAAPRDTPWDVSIIRRALSPLDKTGNIKKIFLGTIDAGVANDATTLKLTADFDPEILKSQEYSLEGNNYLWVDNPGGPDYRSLLTATPWEASAADEIDIQSKMETDDADGNQVPDGGNELPNIAGLRIYVRRLRDVRSVEERRYSIITSMGGSERLPIRDYVIQPEAGTDWVDRIQAIAQVERTDTVTNGANIELRYSARPDSDTAFSPTVYYRPADTVRRNNKHWTARVDTYGAWDSKNWDESYVHMNDDEYCPEGFFTNAQPIIVFNEDKSQAEDSPTLGNSLSSGIEKAQLVSGVDYIATQQFLENLGESAADVETMLTPQLEGNRNLDVSAEAWVVEFRRPTTIRLFGHAFEWAGYSNYSKALPQYQGDLSQSNQFTYYFTNEDGGKVYGSGFNQDGLLVTPRGLQDVTTGETLDLEDISNPDRPIDIPEVEFVWSRAGTTLLPTNLGDDVTVVSSGGAVNISLNNDGSAEYVAKVQSASTVDADPGKTLVTKDFITGTGKVGDIGFWTRQGTDLFPVNGNTDSLMIGGTLPSDPIFDPGVTFPNVTLAAAGSATINGLTVGQGAGDIISNTVVGRGALKLNVSATNIVAIGQRALENNTIGNGNTAVGYGAIKGNTEGTSNTAVGNNALRSNLTGDQNTAMGQTALNSNTTGERNTVLGHRAFYRSEDGDSNVIIGCNAGEQALGSNNTFVGENAGLGNGAKSDIHNYNTFIGSDAASQVEGDNNTFLGSFNGVSGGGAGSQVLSDTISLSAGTTEKLRIDDTGSLLFGGVLPGAANITLSNAGTVTAISMGAQNGGFNDPGNGLALFFNSAPNVSGTPIPFAIYDVYPATPKAYILKDGTSAFTNVIVGGAFPNAPNIELRQDGSSLFQNLMQVIMDDTTVGGQASVINFEGYVGGVRTSRFVMKANGEVQNRLYESGAQVVKSSFRGGELVCTEHVRAGGTIDITSGVQTGWSVEMDGQVGELKAVNTVVQPISSERRLKENIVAIDADTAWETIKSTPYYAYNFIGNESTSYGPMADEVPAEMVVQPMVEDEDGNKVARSDKEGPIRTYDNGMLQARLYTALQTALTRIEALEAEVNALKGN